MPSSSRAFFSRPVGALTKTMPSVGPSCSFPQDADLLGRSWRGLLEEARKGEGDSGLRGDQLAPDITLEKQPGCQ